jgi:prevent-host-death family protein
MKKTTIAASEFKAKCLHLLDEVEEQGQTLVITKRGRPIAKIVPISPPRRFLRGTWKGMVKIKGDIVHFDTSEDWESSR